MTVMSTCKCSSTLLSTFFFIDTHCIFHCILLSLLMPIFSICCPLKRCWGSFLMVCGKISQVWHYAGHKNIIVHSDRFLTRCSLSIAIPFLNMGFFCCFIVSDCVLNCQWIHELYHMNAMLLLFNGSITDRLITNGINDWIKAFDTCLIAQGINTTKAVACDVICCVISLHVQSIGSTPGICFQK